MADGDPDWSWARLKFAAIAIAGYAFIVVGWVSRGDFMQGGTKIPWMVVVVAWTVALVVAYGATVRARRRQARGRATAAAARQAERYAKRQARKRRAAR